MGCGCGNSTPTVAAQEVTPQAIDPVQPMGVGAVELTPQTTPVPNTMPKWDGNRLVNHRAVPSVQVVTGFHLMKSTR